MSNKSVKEFLNKKGVEISLKKYGIDVLGSMALGLFATLLVGTILNTIGTKLGITYLTETIWPAARDMTGAAIGVAIAHSLNAPALVIYSAVVVGYIGNLSGGPVGALIATCVSVELGKIVSKETKLDIIVTPATTIIVGSLIATVLGPVLSSGMTSIGQFVIKATELKPFFMGIVVSVVVGMVLTLPISSAALCMMIGLSGLAGGAATAGCSAQMVGFAVASFRENKWGGLFAQGIGTSMLQMGNIVKNPRIWLPATLASAITGPIATCLFHLQMNGAAVSSGMGTCGLVGQIGVYTGWIADIEAGSKAAITPMDWIGLIFVSFLLPGVLSWLFSVLFRKIGWIKEGDMRLDL